MSNKAQSTVGDKRRFGRRMRFAVAVLAAQLLLIATAVAWCVQVALILKNGEVCFVESNRAILYTELILTAFVILFATTVFTLQWKRIKERRRNDDSKGLNGTR